MVTTSTSTSAPQPEMPKPAAAGLATITGLAILANPRIVHASKTLVLDAQFYLGLTNRDSLIGSLRYYNLRDYTFHDEATLYVVHATFARRESGASLPVSGNRTYLDYSFVGDLRWFFSLGPPGPRYLVPDYLDEHNASSSRSHADPNNLPMFTIDPCEQPYVQVTGVAMEVSKTEATFEVTVEQYISCFKIPFTTPQAGGSHLKPSTTFFCHIPDSPKYRNSKKPLPGNKRYVTIGGYFTGVDTSGDESELEQFRLNINHITFCGQYIPSVDPAPSTNPQSSPVKAPGGASAALFAYNPRAQAPLAQP